jgi:arabinan endo-1,5-alpha-L-arabinosidase
MMKQFLLIPKMDVETKLCRLTVFLFLIQLLFLAKVFAMKGNPGFIHDPSSIIQCGNKYYFYGTGGNVPSYVSDDMVNWKSNGSAFTGTPSWVKTYCPNFNGNFWAPDIVFMNNKYYMYYSCYDPGSTPNLATIGLATNPTLDKTSPDYKWTDQGMVVWSNNSTQKTIVTIDPGIFIDSDKRVYMAYGTYAGKLGVVELDATSGKVKAGDTPNIVAYNAEGSQIRKYNGYYWLFNQHGSCCNGLSSTYEITCGRSTSPKGPFLDQGGTSMTSSYGTIFAPKKSPSGKYIGPGHFGSIIVNGTEFISFHYVDAANGSTKIGTGTIKWTNGWPTLSYDWIPNGSNYYVTNSGSNKNWSVTNGNSGTAILQNTATNSTSQKWTFTSQNDGVYSITTAQSGGSSAMVSGCNGAIQLGSSGCNRFFIERAADGSYVMTPVDGSFATTSLDGVKVVQVSDASTASLSLGTYSSSNYQKWKAGTSIITDISVEQDLVTEGIVCYPNPFTSQLTLRSAGDFEYSVYSLAGIALENGKAQHTVSFGGNLPVGMYVIHVQNANGTKVLKVSKN